MCVYVYMYVPQCVCVCVLCVCVCVCVCVCPYVCDVCVFVSVVWDTVVLVSYIDLCLQYCNYRTTYDNIVYIILYTVCTVCMYVSTACGMCYLLYVSLSALCFAGRTYSETCLKGHLSTETHCRLARIPLSNGQLIWTTCLQRPL